jgi:hypothetical protein
MQKLARKCTHFIIYLYTGTQKHISSFIYTHFIIYLCKNWHAEAHISAFIYAQEKEKENWHAKKAHFSSFIYTKKKLVQYIAYPDYSLWSFGCFGLGSSDSKSFFEILYCPIFLLIIHDSDALSNTCFCDPHHGFGRGISWSTCPRSLGLLLFCVFCYYSNQVQKTKKTKKTGTQNHTHFIIFLCKNRHAKAHILQSLTSNRNDKTTYYAPATAGDKQNLPDLPLRKKWVPG